MINRFDPLHEVLTQKDTFRKQLTAWLGMNRHYGMYMGGILLKIVQRESTMVAMVEECRVTTK